MFTPGAVCGQFDFPLETCKAWESSNEWKSWPMTRRYDISVHKYFRKDTPFTFTARHTGSEQYALLQ